MPDELFPPSDRPSADQGTVFDDRMNVDLGGEGGDREQGFGCPVCLQRLLIACAWAMLIWNVIVADAASEASGAGEPIWLLVDINRADQRELRLLPSVGPKLAGAIIQHRDLQGPFERVSDLDDVPGIGEKTLNVISKHCCLQSPPPARPCPPDSTVNRLTTSPISTKRFGGGQPKVPIASR